MALDEGRWENATHTKRSYAVISYDVVISDCSAEQSVEEFTREVNKRLLEGWSLAGGVTCAMAPCSSYKSMDTGDTGYTSTVIMMQAMTREFSSLHGR